MRPAKTPKRSRNTAQRSATLGADAAPGNEDGNRTVRWVNEHRYTGSELSSLLEQVRRELGSEANIVKADRVRTGGVAGFFARETFEVVAAPAASARPQTPTPTPTPAPAPGPLVPPPTNPRRGTSKPASINLDARDIAERPTGLPVPTASAVVPRPQPSSGGISSALLQRAEAISAQERANLSRQAQKPRFKQVLDVELRSPTTSRPETPTHRAVAPASQAIAIGEPAVVETAVLEPAVVEPAVVEPAITDGPVAETVAVEAASTRPAEVAATTDVETSPKPDRARPIELAPALELDAPVDLRTAVGLGADEGVEAATSGSNLHAPLDALIVIVVGDLPEAMTLAERLAAKESRDLLVLTKQPTVKNLACTSIGRHYEEVSRRLFDWTVQGRAGVVVVDLDLGSRLDVELRCLQSLGAELVRLAVTSTSNLDHLLGAVTGLQCPVVADVVDDDGDVPSPSDLGGIPIVSTNGRNRRARYPLPVSAGRPRG